MPQRPWNILDAVQNNKPLTVDPLAQAGALEQIKNLRGSGLIQQQQISAGNDAAASRQSAIAADAQVGEILKNAKIDENGDLDAATENALIQNGSPHAQAILTNVSTVSSRKSNNRRDAALTQQGKDTLAEQNRHNSALETQAANTPRNIDPNSQEGVAAAIAKSQGEYHPPVAPRNIDPNSPEGIAAQIRLKTAESKLKPAADANLPPLQSITQTTQSGRRYIDASQVEPKTLNELQIAAAKSGMPVVNKDTAGMLTEIDTAKQNLDLMMQTLQPKLATGAASRIFVGTHNKISEFLQSDDDLAAVGTYRNAAIQAMRAVAGAKGLRINRSEIELAIENDIPKVTDTVGAAQAKIQKMGQFLENMEKAHLVQDRSGAVSQDHAASGGNVAPEGTIITNGQQKLIKRGGKWVPQ